MDPATRDTIGLVKVGENLSIDGNGTISQTWVPLIGEAQIPDPCDENSFYYHFEEVEGRNDIVKLVDIYKGFTMVYGNGSTITGVTIYNKDSIVPNTYSVGDVITLDIRNLPNTARQWGWMASTNDERIATVYRVDDYIWEVHCVAAGQVEITAQYNNAATGEGPFMDTITVTIE